VTLIDLSIVGLTLLAIAWGFWRGLTVRTLALVGFGAGAVLGSRVAPLVLNGGLHSVYAPALALPGGLIFGSLLAAAVERVGLYHRRRLERLGPADGIAGALLAGCLGILVAWILGAAATQVDRFKDPLARSEILERLNAVLPPPGPLLVAEAPSPSGFPIIEGPAPNLRKVNPRITRDPDIRAAARSVVEVGPLICKEGAGGSGWIAADGMVVTNAHIATGEDTIKLRVQGRGQFYEATTVWFDKRNDIALLRAPGLKGMDPLPLSPKPKAGTPGAVLGFPFGRRQTRPGRIGLTSTSRAGSLAFPPGFPRKLARGFPRRLKGRPVTSFGGLTEPGNSGGPVVDARGRVLATIFGGYARAQASGLGVPNQIVRSALRRAGPPVDTGSCPD